MSWIVLVSAPHNLESSGKRVSCSDWSVAVAVGCFLSYQLL